MSQPIRPLEQLPPLEFPISAENWRKYHPTVEEYLFMVDEHFRRKGFDPMQVVFDLSTRPQTVEDDEWDFEKYEYF